jgi:hypothetical protein
MEQRAVGRRSGEQRPAKIDAATIIMVAKQGFGAAEIVIHGEGVSLLSLGNASLILNLQ